MAPEGLKEYITQRGRWCLGFMQIVRGRSGPLSLNSKLAFHRSAFAGRRFHELVRSLRNESVWPRRTLTLSPVRDQGVFDFFIYPPRPLISRERQGLCRARLPGLPPQQSGRRGRRLISRSFSVKGAISGLTRNTATTSRRAGPPNRCAIFSIATADNFLDLSRRTTSIIDQNALPGPELTLARLRFQRRRLRKRRETDQRKK